MEASTGFFERLMGAKSIEKVVEVNNDFARSSYEGFVSQATKMGELYTTRAKDAFKPMEEAFAKAQAVAK